MHPQLLTTNEIYEVLDSRRIELGLSQAEASDLIVGRHDSSFFQGLRRGSMPSAARLEAACRALRLDFRFGSHNPGDDLRLGAPGGEPGLLTPARLPELERSAHTLARLVADAGGDPIPEDLRPALTPPPPVELADAEVLHRVATDDLDGPLPPGTRQIEVRELAAAAGGGALELDETVKGYLAFQRMWLDRHGVDPAQCTVIGVVGESMAPTLPAGCSILVDRSRRRRRVGRIFVARLPGDGLVVKRLGKAEDSETWLLLSDHPQWKKKVPWPNGAEVIGEVRWAAQTFG